jgi:hypothetical protein
MRTKTKKVSGIDLGPSCFAFVGNLEDTNSWKLPIYVPGNPDLTRNLISSALERFMQVKLPEAERLGLFLVLAGAAKAHGIKLRAHQFNIAVNELAFTAVLESQRP